MVLHFPTKLTEEEEALQQKFAKLRRKKKQLQEVNKPKQEPEQNKLKRPVYTSVRWGANSLSRKLAFKKASSLSSHSPHFAS